MARNVDLNYSPDESIWYYQKRDYEGKVSKKEYKTKEEALEDYYFAGDPDYEWEQGTLMFYPAPDL